MGRDHRSSPVDLVAVGRAKPCLARPADCCPSLSLSVNAVRPTAVKWNDLNCGDTRRTVCPLSPTFNRHTDNCQDTDNTDQADIDDDGVGDACDNCVDVANADQADDDDGEPNDFNNEDCVEAIGNNAWNDTTCDGSRRTVCPLSPTFNRHTDNCQDTDNANQADSDDDGVGDACDNCVDVANVDQADDDDDGVGNVCEI